MRTTPIYSAKTVLYSKRESATVVQSRLGNQIIFQAFPGTSTRPEQEGDIAFFRVKQKGGAAC